jgi:hypothetical protein
VPGILEGRRRADEGRSAGLTSSPDFFLSIWGFRLDLSGSSSSEIESSSDAVREVSGLRRRSTNTEVSVFDLLWAILRRVSTVDCSTYAAVGLSSVSIADGMINVKAWLAFETSSAVRFGELSRCCSIILMAACSSAKFSNCRPLSSFVSSSLEFDSDSGGEITAPAGSCASSVMGGGDCLTLPDAAKSFVSWCSFSAVPGGEGSREGWNEAVFTEVVRRCLVK